MVARKRKDGRLAGFFPSETVNPAALFRAVREIRTCSWRAAGAVGGINYETGE